MSRATRRTRVVALAVLVGAAVARMVVVFGSEPVWVSVSAVPTALRTRAHEVWRVDVRAHGFGSMAHVSLDSATEGVSVVGRRSINEVPAGVRVSFRVRVSNRRTGGDVIVSGIASGGRVVRRVVPLRAK